MAPLRSLAAAALTFAAAVTAHFTLDYPPTLGFDEDNEPSGPCGGAKFDSSSNVTDFHVDGDNIAMNLLHPQGSWLFRATLDTSASGNWTQLFPEVQQSGLGKFCEPMITVNSSWAGMKGLVSAVVNAPDGVLYQCAAVNFVKGKASGNQPACTNSSGVTFSLTSDAGLSTVAPNTGSSSSSSSPSPSSSHNAAAGLVGGSIPVGNVVVVLAMGLMGAAFVL